MQLGTRVVIVGTDHENRHGIVVKFDASRAERNTHVQLDTNGRTLMFDATEAREETVDDLAGLPSDEQRHLLSAAYTHIHAAETETSVKSGWETLYDQLTDVMEAA